MSKHHVCRAEDVKDGDVRIFNDENISVGIYKIDGIYYAYRNICPHQGGPACEGIMVHKVVDVIDSDKKYVRQDFDTSIQHIVCPWHGWEFDLTTGVCAADPRYFLQRYEVLEEDGKIYVVT